MPTVTMKILDVLAAVFTIVGIGIGAWELRAANREYHRTVDAMPTPTVPGTHPLGTYAAVEHYGEMFESLYRGNVRLRIGGASCLVSGVLLSMCSGLVAK